MNKFEKKAVYFNSGTIASNLKRIWSHNSYKKQISVEEVIRAVIEPKHNDLKVLNNFILGRSMTENKFRGLLKLFIMDNVVVFPAYYANISSDIEEICIVVKELDDIDLDLFISEGLRHNVLLHLRNANRDKKSTVMKELRAKQKLDKQDIEQLLDDEPETEEAPVVTSQDNQQEMAVYGPENLVELSRQYYNDNIERRENEAKEKEDKEKKTKK